MAPGGAPSSGWLLLYEHFGKHTNSKNFLFLHLPPLPGAPRLVHCGPYTMACSAPLRRGTSAERLVEVATEAQRHRWPGAAPLAP